MKSLQLEWQALLAYCKDHGLTVKFVDNHRLHDFAAMNPQAGKAMGFPIKKNEILMDKNPDLARRVHNLKHELIERNLMLEGDSYWKAHCIALQRERQRAKRMR